MDPWAMLAVVATAALGGVTFRHRGLRESLDLFRGANAELRAEVTRKDELIDQHHRECSEQIAELRGQVQVLRSEWTSGLAGQVADRVVSRVEERLEELTR